MVGAQMEGWRCCVHADLCVLQPYHPYRIWTFSWPAPNGLAPFKWPVIWKHLFSSHQQPVLITVWTFLEPVLLAYILLKQSSALVLSAAPGVSKQSHTQVLSRPHVHKLNCSNRYRWFQHQLWINFILGKQHITIYGYEKYAFQSGKM